ncbi:universal stress protein [Mucilaginibacter sp. AK015]|uniref:universal stress protein n=1 Tax=Mucilaginibacter sp. AK015 TaxID=2723072 RepID=UPI00160BA54E|nr:universal stress protein [Mucilaginibacter sp. AK015]MBB5396859.1 nucleotide-binding universal stress UspA family protein [Mucilaginibacter sp. AK015]
MKTFLIPTDFSEAATNAARYGLFLARHLQADVQLIHAFKVPAEARAAAQSAWPLNDYEQVKHDAVVELDNLRHQLEMETIGSPAGNHISRVSGTAELGEVSIMVRNLVDHYRSPMVVMGMSGAGKMHRLLLGSNSQELIDKATFPVLLIPNIPAPRQLKKIAFATDLNKGDIDLIHSLASLARPFNAEILIVHVTNDKYDAPAHQHLVDEFLNEVTAKAHYGQIYYRHVKSMDVDHGLDWLSEHGQVDMLAMVHRPHFYLEKILKGSHTQRLARHIRIPLLVFPREAHGVCF